MEFPGVVFGAGISKGSNTILWNIQRLSFLSGIPRVKIKKKIPGGWNSPMVILNHFFEDVWEILKNTNNRGWCTLAVITSLL